MFQALDKVLRPLRRTGHSPSVKATAQPVPLLAVAPFPTLATWTDEYLREAHERAPFPTLSFVSQGSYQKCETVIHVISVPNIQVFLAEGADAMRKRQATAVVHCLNS